MMNFPLNGRTVSVMHTWGHPSPAIRVDVDGVFVGTRPTMDAALTLATVATADGPARPVSAERMAARAGVAR